MTKAATVRDKFGVLHWPLTQSRHNILALLCWNVSPYHENLLKHDDTEFPTCLWCVVSKFKT